MAKRNARLTDLEADILTFFKTAYEYDLPPSYRELAKHCQVSVTTAYLAAQALIDMGYLAQRKRKSARNLYLVGRRG